MSKEKGMLFFDIAFHLVALEDPTEMRIAVKDRKVLPIPARKSINYLGAGLPHCAGYAIHGSNLYMMEGHWMRKEALDDPTKIPNVESPAAGEVVINSKVYVLDLTIKSMEFEFSPIYEMNAPKNKPKVLEVESKLYVMSNFSHMPESYGTPTFEVYDPNTNRVEALPEPPAFHDQGWFDERGKKIFVMIENLFYYYKLNTKRWSLSVTEASTIERAAMCRSCSLMIKSVQDGGE